MGWTEDPPGRPPTKRGRVGGARPSIPAQTMDFAGSPLRFEGLGRDERRGRLEGQVTAYGRRGRGNFALKKVRCAVGKSHVTWRPSSAVGGPLCRARLIGMGALRGGLLGGVPVVIVLRR